MNSISLNRPKAPKVVAKEVWIGWISSLVEAYNMAIYSFIAPLLAPLLFQNASTWSAFFFSYSLVFVGSCLLYPAGAIYYGLIGDREGRQKICIYSTLGLAVATGLMGLVPIAFLGNAAWVCFLLLIGAQHFFSGGEYQGSIVFSLEHAEDRQGGLMSSLSCLFAVFGLAAANGLAAFSFLMQDPLWIRLCFFIGAIGGLISYVLKNHCQETPAFVNLVHKRVEEVKWGTFIRTEWCKILRAVSVWAFFIVSYSFIFIFLPLVDFGEGISQNFDTFKSLIAYGVFLMTSGWIADRIGIQKTMLAGACLFSLAIIPLCYFSPSLLVLQMLLTPCACLVIAPIHSWVLRQFDVRHRCRGMFLSAAISTSLFGGSTVPICLMIFEASHSLVICGLYPLVLALSTCLSLIYMEQKQEVSA